MSNRFGVLDEVELERDIGGFATGASGVIVETGWDAATDCQWFLVEMFDGEAYAGLIETSADGLRARAPKQQEGGSPAPTAPGASAARAEGEEPRP